jgi:hypothetical protein
VALTEPFDVFFADFAVSVTLAGATVKAIFDADFEVGSVGSIGMAARQPMLTLPTSSVPADPVGAAVVVGSSSYTVAEHRPDGTGVSQLLLEAA